MGYMTNKEVQARETLGVLRKERGKMMSQQESLSGGGWKYRLGAGIAVVGVLLTACNGAVGGGVTPSPVVGEVTETLVAPTETMEPTVEATEVVEEMKVFVEDKIEYGGHEMDFRITMDKNDKIVQDALDYFNIDQIRINEKNPEAKELIAKTLAYSLVETYNYQNGENKTLEEYVSNPEKYPARIMALNEEGNLVEQTITLDQIKEFELRYTSGLDGELYYHYPQIDIKSIGYGFENGKLIFYFPISKSDPGLNNFKKSGGIYLLGNGSALVGQRFTLSNILMPYSVEFIKDSKKSDDLLKNIKLILNEYNGIRGYYPVKGQTDNQYVEYLIKKDLFETTVK